MALHVGKSNESRQFVFLALYFLGLLLTLGGWSVGSGRTICSLDNQSVSSAEDAQSFDVGTRIPDVTLNDPEGSSVDLGWLIEKKPTVLMFYQGGLSLFCTTHLGKIKTVEQNLLKLARISHNLN